MKLREWVFRTRITRKELAKKLGITEQYISLLRRGTKSVSDKLLLKIYDLTGGLVAKKEDIADGDIPDLPIK
jgi:transcriptional regulator with XRE-family HTH domain